MAQLNSAGWHVRAFMAEYLRHTKGRWAGTPIVCEPWQVLLTDELFRLDSRNRRVYRNADIGVPRKNSKSTLGAGFGLYMLGPDGEPGPEVYVSAGSRDQADMVFGQAKDFVNANPRLRDWFMPQQYSIRCLGTKGFMRKLAADGKLNHGLNPHAVIMDELHAYVSPRQEANYEALTTADMARDQPLTMGITTAGDDPDSILGKLHKAAMEHPRLERIGPDREKLKAGLSIVRDTENGRLFIWWGADDDADIENPAVWMAANPASWITEDIIRQKFNDPNVPEVSFRKLHLNQFVKVRQAWLPYGTWQGCYAPQLQPDGAISIGVDIGITNDTSAVAWASVKEDGRLVVRSHVWSARDDVPHDTFVPGGRVDLAVIEQFIRDLAKRHRVDRLLYDPRFFERSAQLLSDDGMVVAPLHQSTQPMADAYQEFYMDARNGVIAHNGDAILGEHVESTAGIKTERGWKVSKLKSSKRIDACVAAVMALYGARRIGSTPRPWVGVA